MSEQLISLVSGLYRVILDQEVKMTHATTLDDINFLGKEILDVYFKKRLKTTSDEERLEGIPEEKRLEGIPDAKLLERISAENMLKNMPPQKLAQLLRLAQENP